MGNIHIDPEVLRASSQNILQLGQQLEQTEQQIQKMIQGLHWQGESRKPFQAQWDKSIQEFQKLAQEAKQLASFCQTAADSFQQADEGGFMNLLGEIGSFAKGFAVGGIDAIVGTATAVLNPLDTLQNMGNLAANILQHPGVTLDALGKSFNDNVLNGTSETRGHFVGELAGTLFNPIGEIGAATGFANLAQIGHDMNLISQAEHLADVALEPDKHEGLPGLEEMLDILKDDKGEE